MGAAVVFDCDGVLVDSESIIDGGWVAALASFGVVASDADFEWSLGRSDMEFYSRLEASRDLPEWSSFSQVLQALSEDRMRAEMKAFDDAATAAAELALQGVPLAVASSSSRWRLDISLEVTGLRRYFDTTVAGDEVPRAKPAPDVYLGAAAGLRVDPGQCLAIEDSAIGVQAAGAAGMRVLAVVRPGSPMLPCGGVDALSADLILTTLGLR